MIYKFANTLEKGSYRHIVFQDGKTWYAVALEFNLVVSAAEPVVALVELYEAVAGYLESVKKSKSRPFALNQRADKEYEELWKALTGKKTANVKSPYNIYNYGVANLI